MQVKEIEKDTEYILLKCDDLYLSLILMPHTLYDKLSDILIVEDVDYFWSLHTNVLSVEEYEVTRDKIFKRFGKRATLTGTEFVIWILGSLPEQLLPYLKRLKD